MKSGFITLLGKPNSGKSTLLNAILAKKISIISDKEQTTRRPIIGIKTIKDKYQIIFIDTPGIFSPKNLLGEKMNKYIKDSLKDVEIVALLIDLSQPFQFTHERELEIIDLIKKSKTNKFLIFNKIDKVNLNDEKIKDLIKKYENLMSFDEIFFISALNNEGITKLEETFVKYLPEGPLYYPENMETDIDDYIYVSEIIREKLFNILHQELPYSIAVKTEQIQKKKDDLIYINAIIYVQRNSHKKIVIGQDGRILKKVGTIARQELENHFKKRIYLDLWVKVKEKWKDRPDILKALGYY